MKKAGILGGGQLGRMLLQAAANYPFETFVMENDPECPAAHLCHHFTTGDIRDFQQVYEFGKNLDALTIEIESVNVEALQKLEQEGVKVYPGSKALSIIKNKSLQKRFYAEHEIPTSPFVITANRAELEQHNEFFPAVHKLSLGGYDGRGVRILNRLEENELAFDEEAVLEKKISIRKEIAIIVGVSDTGETVIYPPSEMVFDQSLNLLSYQISPVVLIDKLLWKAEAIALAVVKNLKSAGIFAVELFLDIDDNVWVNETAPRVHNSGHHTIEGNYSSQFDMLWRIIAGYPLGNTDPIMSSALVNLIGSSGHSGAADFPQLSEILKIDNVFVHLYGKKECRPGRKMGHVTILSNERQHLIHIANKVKQIWDPS